MKRKTTQASVMSLLMCWLMALVCAATLGQHVFAGDIVQEDQRFIALNQKYHADFGGSIQLWKSGDNKLAANYEVKPLEA